MKPDRVVIYTQGWTDRAIDEGEEATALLHGRVFVNGVEIETARPAVVTLAGGEFATVELTITPGAIEIVPCTREQFAMENPMEGVER